MEAAGVGVETVILEFRTHRLGGDIEGDFLHDADDEFFAELLRGVVKLQAKIDTLIEKRLAKNWTLARLDATARAILRAASYEFIHRADIPAAAVINEYVEIAKAFFGEDDRRFINAVLDGAARDLRSEEVGEAGRG